MPAHRTAAGPELRTRDTQTVYALKDVMTTRGRLALCDELEVRACSREVTDPSPPPFLNGCLGPQDTEHHRDPSGNEEGRRAARSPNPSAQPSGRGPGSTYVMLFWCSVSRAVLRSSVVARLSMLRKRSMADMLRWMLCFGMSSLETKVKQPRSSQLKSMGQQSWP